MTNKSMIEVRGLPLQVLKGIDLEIARGEVVAVIGRSGSGKTTMLRCLNGLEEAQVGTIRLGEHTINCTVPLSRQQGELRALRLRAGFVFQNFNLFHTEPLLRM